MSLTPCGPGVPSHASYLDDESRAWGLDRTDARSALDDSTVAGAEAAR